MVVGKWLLISSCVMEYEKEQDNLERAAECYMAALNIRLNFPQVRWCDIIYYTLVCMAVV
jgi:hypothetical protein